MPVLAAVHTATAKIITRRRHSIDAAIDASLNVLDMDLCGANAI